MKLTITIETDQRRDLSGYPHQVRVTDQRFEMIELFDSARGQPPAHFISGIVERFIEQLPVPDQQQYGSPIDATAFTSLRNAAK